MSESGPVGLQARVTRSLPHAPAPVDGLVCSHSKAIAELHLRSQPVRLLLRLVALTLDHVQAAQPGIGEIGLLASTAVRETGLYARACEKRSLSIRFPANQEAVFGLIRQLKADPQIRESPPELEAALANLVEDGADCVVLACTELCLLAQPLDAPVPVYDTLQILAEEVVRIGKGAPL